MTTRHRISGPVIDLLRTQHEGHTFVFVPQIAIPGQERQYRHLVCKGFDQSASSDYFIITGKLGGIRVDVKVMGYGLPGKEKGLGLRCIGIAEVTVYAEQAEEPAPVPEATPSQVHVAPPWHLFRRHAAATSL